jgi:hypothetical protein
LRQYNRVVKLSPIWRKVALSGHVTSSVGWLGAVVAFLVLAIIGLRGNGNEGLVRSAYVSMEAIGWYVILPFSLASLISGLIQSLGTQWGLFRYYWVVAKLVITVGASALLLLHMTVMTTVAEAATAGALLGDHLRNPRVQLAGDAAAAVVVLSIAVGLSVFKPEGRLGPGEKRTPFVYVCWAALGVLAVAIVIRHLSGGMMGHH